MFTRATYAMRRVGLCDSDVSVCLSITTGTVSKRKWFLYRLIATWFQLLSRYDSSKNSQGVTPSEGDLWDWGGFERAIFRPISRRISVFDQYIAISRIRCILDTKLLEDTNRKSYASYWMVSLSMPLSDPWGPWPGFQTSRGFVSYSWAFLLRIPIIAQL